MATPLNINTKLINPDGTATREFFQFLSTGLGAAGGDLLGQFPNPTVAKIQNRSVSSAAPANGNALAWNSGNNDWEPTLIPGTGTVTSVGTSGGLTGGPITTTGTLSLAAGGVHQAQINTNTGTVSQSVPGNTFATGSNITLPGGSYGFYPRVHLSSNSVSSKMDAVMGCMSPFTGVLFPVAVSFANGSDFNSTAATSNIFLVGIGNGDSGVSAQADQTYINASPPYDMGDGDVNGFIFVAMKNGSPTMAYSAPDPPWAYNGPQGGANMPLIPHPFLFNDLTGTTIVLLDPMSPMVAQLLAEQQAGEDIHTPIYTGKIGIGNTPLNRHGPPGVIQVAIR